MSILRIVLPELNDLIRKGIYVNNLSRIESICKGAIILGQNPTAFFVLQSICSELRRAWEDHAVTVEEYNNVRNELTGPIQDVLNSVELNMEEQLAIKYLDNLVIKFIELRGKLL